MDYIETEIGLQAQNDTRQKIDFCLKYVNFISDWDEDFCLSLIKFHFPPDKQLAKLEEIADKVRARLAAPAITRFHRTPGRRGW
jgi:hypothetical protein